MFALPVATPTPLPTPTPAPDNYYQQQYQKLKQAELRGEAVNDEIIAVIRKIVRALQRANKEVPDDYPAEVLEKLVRADRFFQNNALVSPVDDNALKWYLQVLDSTPQHSYARDQVYRIAKIYDQESDDPAYQQTIVDELLTTLSIQFDRTDQQLLNAQKSKDRRQQLIQTLRIIELLREFKRVYRSFYADENVDVEEALRKTEALINEYEQVILR